MSLCIAFPSPSCAPPQNKLRALLIRLKPTFSNSRLVILSFHLSFGIRGEDESTRKQVSKGCYSTAQAITKLSTTAGVNSKFWIYSKPRELQPHPTFSSCNLFSLSTQARFFLNLHLSWPVYLGSTFSFLCLKSFGSHFLFDPNSGQPVSPTLTPIFPKCSSTLLDYPDLFFPCLSEKGLGHYDIFHHSLNCFVYFIFPMR